MEEGDYDALAFWKRVRDVNVTNYARLYARLGIYFDEYSGESQVSPESMAEVEEILKSKGLLEESGGSWIINLKKHTKKAGAAIIRDRTGSSTYLLRDIATVFDRYKRYLFNKMLYVVAADHALHFSRLFKVLELMDQSDLASKLQHVIFSEVSKISHDANPWHTFDEILDQCQIAMRESIHSNPEKAYVLCTTGVSKASIGTAALVAQELSAKRSSDNALDFSQMTSFDTGTGPNIQFWYARLCSVLKSNPVPADIPKDEFASLTDVDQLNLLRLIAQYPDVTLAAYNSLEPVMIMAYVNHVVEQLSCCVEESGDVHEMGPAQTMLFEVTRIVLENGMNLLGIRMSTS
jgi:arginyl-tRNA synthetase